MSLQSAVDLAHRAGLAGCLLVQSSSPAVSFADSLTGPEPTIMGPGPKPKERREVGKVVHVKHEPFDIYIGQEHSGWGRGPRFKRSSWHNPYNKMFRRGEITREEAIAKYERYLLEERPDLVERLPELRGKILGCWCAPEPCHGDVLVRLAEDSA
jgi:hypothetical protein